MNPLRKVVTAATFTAIAISASILATSTADAQTPAPAQRITTCGQTITKPRAYLAHDLVCSTGFTFSPTDDNAVYTFDLKGHRLQGKGTNRAITVDGDAATLVTMSIANGRIDHWDTAVFSQFGVVSLRKLTIDSNTNGMLCGKGTCDTTDAILSHNKLGSSVFDGALTFTRTLFSRNTVASDVPASFFAQGTYSNSQFIGNGTGVSVTSGSEIYVKDSVFTGNGTGVKSDGSGGADLSHNLFALNHDGIYLSTPDFQGFTRLKDNSAYSNARYGIYAPGAIDLGGNHARSNGKPCVGVVCAP